MLYSDSVNSIRILPNDKKTFPSMESFKTFICDTMVKRNGFYYFPNTMMNCPKKTLVLFQYDGKICAVGILVDAVKKPIFDEADNYYAGYYKFDVSSLYFLNNHIGAEAMKQAYPQFRCFNQSKQIIPIEYKESIIEMIRKNNTLVCVSNKQDVLKKIDEIVLDEHIKGKEKDAMVKIRINQSFYRDLLLNKYGKCCLCGERNRNLLIASHIKPWRNSDENEKVNPYNGLLLCPNHDKLFDLGLISFNDAGVILISNELSEETAELMNINDNMKIDVEEQVYKFMEFHRNHIFRK